MSRSTVLNIVTPEYTIQSASRSSKPRYESSVKTRHEAKRQARLDAKRNRKKDIPEIATSMRAHAGIPSNALPVTRRAGQRRGHLITPPPVTGREHEILQTEEYLEELVSEVSKSEICIQTDPVVLRTESPRVVNPPTAEFEVQVGPENLDHMKSVLDNEAEVVVNHTLEVALREVKKEKEISKINQRYRELEKMKDELSGKEELMQKEISKLEQQRIEAEEVLSEKQKEVEKLKENIQVLTSAERELEMSIESYHDYDSPRGYENKNPNDGDETLNNHEEEGNISAGHIDELLQEESEDEIETGSETQQLNENPIDSDHEETKDQIEETSDYSESDPSLSEESDSELLSENEHVIESEENGDVSASDSAAKSVEDLEIQDKQAANDAESTEDQDESPEDLTQHSSDLNQEYQDIEGIDVFETSDPQNAEEIPNSDEVVEQESQKDIEDHEFVEEAPITAPDVSEDGIGEETVEILDDILNGVEESDDTPEFSVEKEQELTVDEVDERSLSPEE